MTTVRKICVGQFVGAHGVQGLLKLRSFTQNPKAIFDYTPLTEKEGKRIFKVSFKSAAKDHFVVKVDGIDNRDQADQLRGDGLYVSHSLLPKAAKGEYYEADLIGLEVSDKEGKCYGRVINVFDYGAGIFLEIGHSKKDSFMLPFRDPFVPEVDMSAGTLVIIIPEGWP